MRLDRPCRGRRRAGGIFRGGKELRFVGLANQVASGFVAGTS